MAIANNHRQEARKKEKRQQILEACRRLMARGEMANFKATTLAKELDWTTPGLYYYFPNLEAIRYALAQELMEESTEATLEGAKRGNTGREALLLAFDARINFYAARPNDYDLVWTFLPQGKDNQKLLQEIIYPASYRLNDYLEGRMLEDQKQGLISSQVDCRKRINLMICLAHGLLSMYLNLAKAQGNMKHSLEEMIEEAKTTLVAGF